MAEEATTGEIEEIVADLDFFLEMDEATALETEEEAQDEEARPDEPAK